MDASNSILRIISRQSTQINQNTLILMNTRTSLVRRKPRMILIRATVLRTLIRTRLIIAMILSNLHRILRNFNQNLTNISTRITNSVLMTFQNSMLIMLQPEDKLLEGLTIMTGRMQRRSKINATINSITRNASNINRTITRTRRHKTRYRTNRNNNIIRLLLDINLNRAELTISKLDRIIPSRLNHIRNRTINRIIHMRKRMNFRQINRNIRTNIKNRLTQLNTDRRQIRSNRKQNRHMINSQMLMTNLIVNSRNRQNSLKANTKKNQSTRRLNLLTRQQSLRNTLASVRRLLTRIKRNSFQILMRRPRGLKNVRQKTTTGHSSHIQLRLLTRRLDTLFSNLSKKLQLSMISSTRNRAIKTNTRLISSLISGTRLLRSLVTRSSNLLSTMRITRMLSNIQLRMNLDQSLRPLRIIIPPDGTLSVGRVRNLRITKRQITTMKTTTRNRQQNSKIMSITSTTGKKELIPSSTTNIRASTMLARRLLIINISNNNITNARLRRLLTRLRNLLLIINLRRNLRQDRLLINRQLIIKSFLTLNNRGNNINQGLRTDDLNSRLEKLTQRHKIRRKLSTKANDTTRRMLFRLNLLFDISRMNLASLRLLSRLIMSILINSSNLLNNTSRTMVRILKRRRVINNTRSIGVNIGMNQNITNARTRNKLTKKMDNLSRTQAADNRSHNRTQVLRRNTYNLSKQVLGPLSAILEDANFSNNITRSLDNFGKTLLHAKIRTRSSQTANLRNSRKLRSNNKNQINSQNSTNSRTSKLNSLVSTRRVIFTSSTRNLLTNRVINSILTNRSILNNLIFRRAATNLISNRLNRGRILIRDNSKYLNSSAVGLLLIRILRFIRDLLNTNGRHIGLNLDYNLLLF